MSASLPIPPSDRAPQVFTAAAGQTVFTPTIPLLEDGDAVVEKSINGGLTYAPLTLGIDYQIIGSNQPGGFTVALAVGAILNDKIRVTPLAPIANTTDFSPANTVKREGLNRKIDRLTVHAQELRRDVDRALEPIDGLAEAVAEAQAAAAIAVPAKDQAIIARDQAVAAAAGLNLPPVGPSNTNDILVANGTGYDLKDRLALQANTINILEALTAGERTDVRNGTNAIDITAKLKAFIAAAPDGSVIDATALKGNVTFTDDIFSSARTKRATFLTGDVTFAMTFSGGKSFKLPSHFTWVSLVHTRIRPAAPIVSIGGDNSPGCSLVETAFVGMNRTCSGGGGSTTLTVSNAADINPGALLGVFGVEVDNTISHTLGANIVAGTTSITFGQSVAETIEGTFGYFRIGGTEIVRGLVIGGVLDCAYPSYPDAGRGKQGTAAISHTAGEAIVPMLTQTFEVVSVVGTTVTLNQPLARSAVNAEFRCGSINSGLIGRFTIDGEYDKSAPPANVWNCLGATLAKNFKVDGPITLRRAVTGGMMVIGSRDCDFSVDKIEIIGRPAFGLGSSTWMMGGAKDNRMRVRRVIEGNIGVALDNKSSGIIYYGLSQPLYDNEIYVDRILNHITGVDITAAHNNIVHVNYCEASGSAIGIFTGDAQQTAPTQSSRNLVRIGQMVPFSEPTGSALAFGNNNRLEYYTRGVTTPALVPAAGALGSGSCTLAYHRNGPVVVWRAIVTIGAAGSATGDLSLALPFTPQIFPLFLSRHSGAGGTADVVVGNISGSNLVLSKIGGGSVIANNVSITIGGEYFTAA